MVCTDHPRHERAWIRFPQKNGQATPKNIQSLDGTFGIAYGFVVRKQVKFVQEP